MGLVLNRWTTLGRLLVQSKAYLSSSTHLHAHQIIIWTSVACDYARRRRENGLACGEQNPEPYCDIHMVLFTTVCVGASWWDLFQFHSEPSSKMAFGLCLWGYQEDIIYTLDASSYKTSNVKIWQQVTISMGYHATNLMPQSWGKSTSAGK